VQLGGSDSANGRRGRRPINATECPHDASWLAAVLPAGPAPMMATSTSC